MFVGGCRKSSVPFPCSSWALGRGLLQSCRKRQGMRPSCRAAEAPLANLLHGASRLKHERSGIFKCGMKQLSKCEIAHGKNH